MRSINLFGLVFLSTVSLVATFSHAGAPPVTVPLMGEVLDPFDPAFGETATGSFTYDPTLITGVGDEILGVFDGLLVDFTFVGQSFTEADDIDFMAFPELAFLDGVPIELDFVVSEFGFNPVEIDDPRMTGFGILTLEPVPGAGFFAEINTFLIPEPTSAVLIGIAICLGALRRRR